MSGDEISEEELEQLRRRRLAELQRAAADEDRRAEVQQQVETQKQSILKRILTTEARQRLTNIKMVRPDFADQLELQLIQLAQSGKVKVPIADAQLKDALLRLQSQRKDIRIRRM
jgi:programmed cell death protein 5